jgi:hypothetical protein
MRRREYGPCAAKDGAKECGICAAKDGIKEYGAFSVKDGAKEYRDRFKASAKEDEEGDATCQMCEILTVSETTKEKRTKQAWADVGVEEITVDSTADESCWSKDQGGACPTKPSKKNILVKTANGGEMGNYGEKDVTFKDRVEGNIVGLKFQVTDVRKPLRAVRRLVERGMWFSSGRSRRGTTSHSWRAAGRS